ncbi:hypothetical protein [Clostridium vincentii]|uniref:Uncharacterized protein n=1 Tax=Clostridium vincentii TaxID=52704 RepID=A0A2T0BJ02_9CLOT|nr:hypothetical protein [Clostridium vincentii]PRR83869.1 hypothetical protein CLVI_05230 [Clostridium vincentii]
MKDTKKRILIGVIILTIIFVGSFFQFNKYLENKNLEQEEAEQTAITRDKAAVLSEDVLIILFKGETQERVTTLKDIKNELALEGQVSEQNLTKVLEKKGYSLEAVEDTELTYKRSIEESIEANKYYIKEYEGYFAIYKSDSDGNLLIENPTTDIFKDKKQFSQLPQSDQDMINNLEFKYTDRNETEDKISELIS